jgi:hypothetical protein
LRQDTIRKVGVRGRVLANQLVVRLKENHRGFWSQYRWFIAVFVAAILCDAASTIHFMVIDGIDAEIHLAIRFVSKILGPVLGPIVGAAGKIAAGFIVGLYFRKLTPYVFAAASIISFAAAWYNIWGIHVLTTLKWIPW